METEQPSITMADNDDPRLRLPAIPMYGQNSLGCSFLFMLLLPLILLMFGIVAEDDEALRYTQYTLLVLVGAWIFMWVSNYDYARKVRRSGRPGTATVIDKFFYFDSENIRQNILVYQFEETTPEGFSQTKQALYACYSSAEFNVPIGSTVNFYSMPTYPTLSKFFNQMPVMWIPLSPRKFHQRISRWAIGSALLLVIAAATALWLRAALHLTALTWPAMFTPSGLEQWGKMILSSAPTVLLVEIVPKVWAFPLAGMAGLGVMVVAFVLWLLPPKEDIL